MTTLRQVAGALETRLATIAGLRTTAEVPEAPTTFPLAFPMPPQVSYEALDLSLMETVWGIVVLVSRNLVRNQLDLLDYQSPTGARSIPALIQADRTLGLSGVDAFVNGSRSLGAEEIAAYNAFGVVFDVPVRIS